MDEIEDGDDLLVTPTQATLIMRWRTHVLLPGDRVVLTNRTKQWQTPARVAYRGSKRVPVEYGIPPVTAPAAPIDWHDPE